MISARPQGRRPRFRRSRAALLAARCGLLPRRLRRREERAIAHRPSDGPSHLSRRAAGRGEIKFIPVQTGGEAVRGLWNAG